MPSTSCLLAIDVGNTSITLGSFRGERLLRQWRIRTDSGVKSEELERRISSRMARAGQKPTAVACASVVPALNPKIEGAARRMFGLKVSWITPRSALGLAYGVDLSQINLLSFVLVTAFSVVSFAALGILTAAFTLIIKRSEAITMLMAGATVLLGGVVYPVSVLPPSLQWIAQFLPFTHALSGVRQAILKGAGPGALLPQLGALVGFAAVLFPLGLWAFTSAIRRAKIRGTLGQY